MENQLLERFLRHPPSLEGGISLRARREGSHHLRLYLQHEAARAELVAAGLSRPYPSGLRRVLAADPDIDAVIVEHIPAGLDEAAEEAGISYLDLQGRGRIAHPGIVYVSKPDRSEVRVSHKAAAPFAPKASRVGRALLCHPDRRWRLSELAGEVDMAPGNAHRVLAALVEAGYVERDLDDYVLVDAGSLLEAWAEASRRRNDYLALAVVEDLDGDVRRFLNLLGDRRDAVVSGELAAEALISYLPAERAVIHVLSAEAWAEVENWKDSRSSFLGERDQILVDRADPGVAHFGDERDGLALVSPVQLYVDLYADRGRGREAAEQVRRELLRF